MVEQDIQEADAIRVGRLAAQSQQNDCLIVECVYHGQLVRFTIDTMQLQHVAFEELWRRYGDPAWTKLGIPAPVRADPAL